MDTGYIKPISICKRCFWSIPLNTGKHLIYKCGNGIECMNQNQYKELKSSDKIEDDIKTRKEREKKMEDMEGMEEINMPVAGEIELPRLNLEPYIGRKSRIAEVKAYKGKYGYVLKVSTEPLDEPTTANGEKRPLRASRLFGLYQNDKGEIGWGEKTKTGIFMQKMKVKIPDELIGKLVTIQVQTNKDGLEFLAF